MADIDFPKPGDYDVIGMAQLDDRLVAALPASGPTVVKKEDPVPDVGDPAPRIHTPVPADVGGDLSQIDTRTPPSTMHEVDFADVVGQEAGRCCCSPRPLLCQSRVCGPVVDIAEQVKSERGKDADFIHMEIFKDNDVDKGFRPQVRDVEAADRAVGVHDRPQRQGGGPPRGRVQRARAERRDKADKARRSGLGRRADADEVDRPAVDRRAVLAALAAHAGDHQPVARADLGCGAAPS